MPYGNISSHEDVPHNCGIGCDKDKALIVDVEIVEIHDVAGTVERVGILAGRLKTLSCEEERREAATETAHHL